MSVLGPRTTLTIVVSFAVWALFTSCAKIVAPPGGPEDKEPPVILSTTPHNLATNLGPESELTVYFSEPLANRSLENLIFISPRQLAEPKIKVSGERLVVKLADTLLENQTYVVTLSANITDLRGNKLGESRSLAFTRGEKIDTGSVAGSVTSADEGVEGLGVALFRNFTPTTMGDLDTLYPDYFTSSGEGGTFKFEYLPPDQYFLLAFSDKDKDQSFRYGVDQFGMGTAAIDLSVSNTTNQELRLQELDTSTVSILSVTNGADQLVRVSFSNTISLSDLSDNLEHMYLYNLADSEVVTFTAGVRSQSGDVSSKFGFYFAELIPGNYGFRIDFDSFFNDGRSWNSEFVEAFQFDPQIDSTAPVVRASSSEEILTRWQTAKWSFTFSEPVKLDSANITDPIVTLSTGARVNHSLVSPTPFTIECSVTDRLIAGELYKLRLPGSSIMDMSKNTLPDSVLAGSHKVWESDSLGSLTLLVSDIRATKPGLVAAEYELTFRRLPDERYVFETAGQDSLEIELPAGDYIIEAREVSDMARVSGSRFDGSMYPLMWADARSFYPDTVHVRPRFDSDKITIIIE